jgi:leader peptidase (prepilin peptidase)/N-methyltransferase
MTPAVFARLLDAWVFAAGACVGSFLNVVIARVPAGRSIVSPPSSCPKCGKPIAWFDNVPLLSWIVLRAKCRNCGQPISARYPLVELLTALLVLAVWRRFGASPAALGYAALVSALVALTFIDLDTWLLPHQITWPLLAVGLASPLWNREIGWSDSAIGAAAGFAAFAAVALVGEKLLKKETMGWGDVWLLAGIGAWLGWPALLPVVLLSALQGSVVGLALLLLGRGPAERARAERERERQAKKLAAEAAASAAAESAETAAAQGGTIALAGTPLPLSDDDWVPPPHAVPYGPFLALGALEMLLARDALLRAFFAIAGKLAP